VARGFEKVRDAFEQAKVDYQINPSNLFTARYNYTWSRQENGTFDVDSWGRSANGLERDWSNAVSGSLLSTVSRNKLNEFRFQLAREDRPRPYNGPDISGQTRPFPDTAFDLGHGYRFGEPYFLPVEYYDTRVQLTDNFSIIKDRHTIKFGGEFNRVNSIQTFLGFANGRYIFTSTDGFFNYVRLGPKYVECSNGTSNATGRARRAPHPDRRCCFSRPASAIRSAGRHPDILKSSRPCSSSKAQPETTDSGMACDGGGLSPMLTPPSDALFGFTGAGFPPTGRSHRQEDVNPRLGVVGSQGDGSGRPVSSGLFRPAHSGLNLEHALTNGS
jgi:hypothetical protein